MSIEKPLSVDRSRQVAMLAFDALATAFALWLALELRFEKQVPQEYVVAGWRTLPLLLAVRVCCNAAARLHRWSFRYASLTDALRVAAATALGTAVFLPASRLFGFALPRTVYALEFFLSASLFAVARFGPRVLHTWLRQGARSRAGAARTVIVGADGEAELLARDLDRSPDDRYQLVGFVCDRRAKVGESLEGHPILGTVEELPAIIRRHQVSMVLLAEPSWSAAQIRHLLDTCACSQARFKIVPAGFAQLDSRLSIAMLNDLAPEDLLPREAVQFDDVEMRSLVAGRRALVTGAGGSIGAEIARQLARYGAKQLVLLDMNENELYLGARRLASQFPGLEIHAEVADVREPDRLLRIGERYRPQDVFHAAAHKHVPLMEDAPEEAVKNNVFGSLHVARMADACGAERFVLISTDKAVHPTSVMGATKRVAELVVRDLARTSRTRMTCVRFGNVLGSAGSVVPIFKEQIARGGPVTVTHPDCTRFFMTIREAVGLVLLAGLGGYGDLCVLDMGEAIKIADLARNLVTLAGHVPGVDIEIQYTGLRPGEKLNEVVLTEEEEQSLAVRNRIRATRSPQPPSHLEAALVLLRRLAEAGDYDGVRHALRSLVPTYRPAGVEPRRHVISRIRHADAAVPHIAGAEAVH
jgi:FlaA1/EpsC-like NDP-sugar epimerase